MAVLIGVDPGSGFNVGVATYQPNTKAFYKIETLSYYGAANSIIESAEFYGKDNTVVVIENPNLNPNVFGANQAIISGIEQYWNKGRKKEVKTIIAKQLQKAQSIGKHKKTSQLMIRELTDAGIQVIEISPTWRQNATKAIKIASVQTKQIQHYRMPTKTTQTQFKQLTGFAKPTSEHARDAGTLVYDQTEKKLKTFVDQWKHVGRKCKHNGWGDWADKNKKRIK